MFRMGKCPFCHARLSYWKTTLMSGKKSMRCEYCGNLLTLDRRKNFMFQFVLFLISGVLGMSYGFTTRKDGVLALFAMFIVLMVCLYPIIVKLKAADQEHDGRAG